MVRSHSLVNLKVVGSSFNWKDLRMSNCDELKSVEISSVPNLMSLKYTGACKGLVLKNVVILVDLYFGVGPSQFTIYEYNQLSNYHLSYSRLH